MAGSSGHAGAHTRRNQSKRVAGAAGSSTGAENWGASFTTALIRSALLYEIMRGSVGIPSLTRPMTLTIITHGFRHWSARRLTDRRRLIGIQPELGRGTTPFVARGIFNHAG